MQETKTFKKSLMLFITSLLLFAVSTLFLFFRVGSNEATLKAILILGYSLLGALISLPLAFFMPKGKKLSYFYSSLFASTVFALFLPLGVKYISVFISSFFMTIALFLFRILFKKPVFHGLLFSMGLMYFINPEGLTSHIDGKSILVNIQKTPLSDLYTVRLLPFSEAVQAIDKDGISLFRLFIGDYLGSIGGGFILVLVILMLFLTCYKSIKGSVSIVYLLSLYLSFFLCFFFHKEKAMTSLTQSLQMILFNDFVLTSLILSDTDYIEKNSLSTYSLTLITSAMTFVISYNVNSYFAILISLFLFDFLYPMFSSIRKKSVSIPLFVISLFLSVVPSILIGLYL